VLVLDREALLRFLRIAFEPGNWVAIFLKSYETGRVTQRVGPLNWVMHPRFQAWLRFKNAQHFNVYVGVNAIAPGHRSRTRESIGAIRHVFLEADHDGAAVLERVSARPDLPSPSYVLHSSTDRVHVFWRVAEFSIDDVEMLQKRLARELGTDPAATPASQATRLPGFLNHKYSPPNLVTIEYAATNRVFTPADFPQVPLHAASLAVQPLRGRHVSTDPVERARRYLAQVPPAIAGAHGDVHTFRVCCRLVRGFALEDADAMALLSDWNQRCEPPWSERELRDKVLRARKYGHEPLAGLLSAGR
jgi:hypothetical protein